MPRPGRLGGPGEAQGGRERFGGPTAPRPAFRALELCLGLRAGPCRPAQDRPGRASGPQADHIAPGGFLAQDGRDMASPGQKGGLPLGPVFVTLIDAD